MMQEKQNPSAVLTTTTATSSMSPTTRLPWCCTARIVGDGNEEVRIEQPSSFLEMSEWMEGIEQSEGREMDAVGAGVYDTWRCDRVLTNTTTSPEGAAELSRDHQASSRPSHQTRWNQWGADFHLDRLSNSYMDAVRIYGESGAEPQSTASHLGIDQPSIDRALSVSRRIVHELLQEADDQLSRLPNEDNWPALLLKQERTTEAFVLFQLVRVTLLWSTLKSAKTEEKFPSSSPSQSIVVRGHACYTGPIQNLFQPHPPVTVSVAISVPSPLPASRAQSTGDPSGTPNRVNQNPHLKVAKWTRVRQQIARPPGVAEVLLTRRQNGTHSDRIQILEGLSSNVFIVYGNGTIRTATDGVLHGFVRQLVLDCLDECDLTFDPEPIWLEEEPNGPPRWSEIFITSSSRLIYPVSTVLIPEHQTISEGNTTASYFEYWKSSKSLRSPQKWQCLLDAILRKGGYTPSFKEFAMRR
jgi:Amino-transferase class IV